MNRGRTQPSGGRLRRFPPIVDPAMFIAAGSNGGAGTEPRPYTAFSSCAAFAVVNRSATHVAT